MTEINELLADLSSRLPELEWKVSGLGTFSSHSLPRGLFQSSFEMTGASCINEIKSDINALSSQKNQRSADYMATKIQQKINVLVMLCQIQKKNKPKAKENFGLNSLSTRQQWIQTLEEDVRVLDLQHQALLRTFEQIKPKGDTPTLLGLQKELGEIEKRLTLAREALNRAVS